MLERIVDGDLEPVILVDFAQFTTAGTLADLLGTPDSGRSIYRADAVQDLEANGGNMSLAQLAEEYVREVAKLPSRPVGVIGYCSAATLALELASRLDESEGAVEVILVEPSWLTKDVIRDEARSLRALLEASGELAPDITLSTVVRTLTGDLVAKFKAEGLPAGEVDMCVALLIERYRAWFGFLFATAETPIPTFDRPVTLVMSGDGGRGPAPSWRPEAFIPISLPMTGSELLTSPAVRQRILSLVEQ